jgi:hypothetical protein
MKHANQVALDDQRHAEQRPDPGLSKQRVQHLDWRDLEVLYHHRLARGCHPAGEPPADRKTKAPVDRLLLHPLGRRRGQRPAVVLDQEDRRGVNLEDLGDPAQQLREQLIEAEEGERGLRDALDVLEARDGLLGGDRLLLGWQVPDRTRLADDLLDLIA